MANRSMNKSQEISNSIDSNSFDHEIQQSDMWDEMYDYLFECECNDCNEDYLASF